MKYSTQFLHLTFNQQLFIGLFPLKRVMAAALWTNLPLLNRNIYIISTENLQYDF